MNAEDFLTQVYSKNPLHRKKLIKNFNAFPYLLEELGSFLHLYQPFLEYSKISPQELASSYLTIVSQMNCARLKFIQTGKYPTEKQEEAYQEVYSNLEVMTPYMLGLAASQFLWPHHYALLDFYKKVLKRLPNCNRFLEVGCGHDLFLIELLKNVPASAQVEAVDISEISLKLTRQLLAAIRPDVANRIQMVHSDINHFESPHTFDFITMGEVIEHVNQPDKILSKIHSFLAPHGQAFITTCVNCPTIDHVYHFQTIQEIRELITQARFKILDEVIAPSEQLPEAELIQKKLDISYGAWIEKIS